MSFGYINTLEKEKCLTFKKCYIEKNNSGGLAQLARASALQAEGQEFESPSLHHFLRLHIFEQPKNITKYPAPH